MGTAWICDPHWTAPKPDAEPTMTKAAAKQAIADALVPVLEGGAKRIDTVVPAVAPVAKAAGMTLAEITAMVEKIADEWANGTGPVVAKYVEPKPPKPEPIVIPEPSEPEPVEDPKPIEVPK